jgi:PEP-CTERM motif
MKFHTKMALAALATVAFTSPAYAVDNYLFGFSPFGSQQLILNGGAFTLNAIETGWYSSNGNHSVTNQNYIVGDCSSCGSNPNFNNYFVFDLSNITAAITSADLSIGNGNGYAAGPLSTFSLFDVNTAIASLDVDRPNNDATGIGIWNDLQGGTLLGTRGITNVVQNSQVVTTLNSDAITALNRARGQQWAIGGTLRPGNVVPGVPEPSTWGMLILGFGIVGASLRRRARLQMA